MSDLNDKGKWLRFSTLSNRKPGSDSYGQSNRREGDTEA